LFDLVTFKIVKFVFFVSVKFRQSLVFAPWSHVGRGCFYLVLMAAALLADPWLRSHCWAAALVAVLVGGYGYGAGLEVNALLDLSSDQLKRCSFGLPSVDCHPDRKAGGG
jgi:hypothetical protein